MKISFSTTNEHRMDQLNYLVRKPRQQLFDVSGLFWRTRTCRRNRRDPPRAPPSLPATNLNGYYLTWACFVLFIHPPF